MKHKPMLAKLGDEKDLAKKGYVYETKEDGIRALIKTGKKTLIYNRLYQDIHHKYPEIKVKAPPCILDGELVVFKNGKSDFKLIEKRDMAKKGFLASTKKYPATLIIFDILELKGKKLTKLPLTKRRKILEKTMKKSKNVKLSKQYKDGKKLWKTIKNKKLEGTIAKKKNSKYIQGRSKNWLKIMNKKTIDVIIDNGKLKVYSKGKLRTIGEMKKKMPKTVIEISYEQFDKKLIKPRFISIRTDKLPKDCILEEQIK